MHVFLPNELPGSNTSLLAVLGIYKPPVSPFLSPFQSYMTGARRTMLAKEVDINEVWAVIDVEGCKTSIYYTKPLCTLRSHTLLNSFKHIKPQDCFIPLFLLLFLM